MSENSFVVKLEVYIAAESAEEALKDVSLMLQKQGKIHGWRTEGIWNWNEFKNAELVK